MKSERGKKVRPAVDVMTRGVAVFLLPRGSQPFQSPMSLQSAVGALQYGSTT